VQTGGRAELAYQVTKALTDCRARLRSLGCEATFSFTTPLTKDGNMALTNEQGQALENALNNIRTKVHDDPELLGQVIAFSDSIGESNVTGEISANEIEPDPTDPSAV
jgi:hypothetical protein